MFSRIVNILKANLNNVSSEMKYDADGYASFENIDQEYERLFGSSGTVGGNFDNQNDNFDGQPDADPTEREYYEALEIRQGASYEEIKAAYKRLIKEYHPDKFYNEPSKHQMALEVTQRLNRSYQYFRNKYEKNVV